MEIGTLNQRIVILEHSTRIDGIGNHKARWEELFSCWAAVSVKNSTETTDAGVTKEVTSLEFIVRQTPDTMRMILRNCVFVSFIITLYCIYADS